MPERKKVVLVVDDKREMAEMLADGLAAHGYESIAAASSKDALRAVTHDPIDLLVTDLRMPEVDGLALLEASRKAAPDRPVIVMTAYGAVDTAVESIRRGAYHYLSKPFKLEELLVFVERALDEGQVRRAVRHSLRPRSQHIFGESRGLRAALDVLERVALADVPVLLLGETGTGKGAFAHALHAASPRASAPFITVNCAALPEALLESELFGHVRGAFTGAVTDRAGLFVEADGGTLLLDEIGEMPLPLQAKLLHVLESSTLRPVGAGRERRVDVRILAATHRNLRERVSAGQFREDLLYRIEVVAIDIPPLRERDGDIALLAERFLLMARERFPQSAARRFSPAALQRLLDHNWPGNVRELMHAVERAVVLARSDEIGPGDLPPSLQPARSPDELMNGEVRALHEIERRYAAWALEQLSGQRGKTAAALEIDGKTLAKLLGGS
jgi:two-component system response regulator HydG